MTGDDIRYKLEEIDGILGKKYRLDHSKKEERLEDIRAGVLAQDKMAMKDLDPLIDEAVSSIKIVHGPGHPHSLPLEQRAKLLLIKQLVGESNRMFANMLDTSPWYPA